MKLIPILALALFACTGTTTNDPDPANRLEADHAPTPFSAEQIRAGCPDGREVVFKSVINGTDTSFRVLRFAGGNEQGVEVSSGPCDADGKPTGELSAARSTWKSLQSHASFPAAQTSIDYATFDGPLGPHPCWMYRVKGDTDGKPSVRSFLFARDLPGPPIVVEHEIAGKVVSRMTMVATK